MTNQKEMINENAVQTSAAIGELQQQRTFLGDRAANLAGENAVLQARLELANGRIAALEKQLEASDQKQTLQPSAEEQTETT